MLESGKGIMVASTSAEARAPGIRPMHDALGGRHEGEDALRLLAKIGEIGRGVAEPEHAQPGVILPAGAQQPRHQPASHLAQGLIVEIAQIDDIERHVR